ncbi:MAG: hypothetical protein KGL95_00745, partial [Patescibacteria group bacterium]|nr:hypothetical protein [Patescibacteria group bacterium]
QNQENNDLLSPTESPSPTIVPTTGVLGANISRNQEKNNYFLFLSLGFFVIGGTFLAFHFFKIFHKKN